MYYSSFFLKYTLKYFFNRWAIDKHKCREIIFSLCASFSPVKPSIIMQVDQMDNFQNSGLSLWSQQDRVGESVYSLGSISIWLSFYMPSNLLMAFCYNKAGSGMVSSTRNQQVSFHNMWRSEGFFVGLFVCSFAGCKKVLAGLTSRITDEHQAVRCDVTGRFTFRSKGQA